MSIHIVIPNKNINTPGETAVSWERDRKYKTIISSVGSKLAIYKWNQGDPNSGYKVYSSMEDIRNDFEIVKREQLYFT